MCHIIIWYPQKNNKQGGAALQSLTLCSSSSTGSLCCRFCCCRFMLPDAVCVFTTLQPMLNGTPEPQWRTPDRLDAPASWVNCAAVWVEVWAGFLPCKRNHYQMFSKNYFPYHLWEDFYLSIGTRQYFKWSRLLEDCFPKKSVGGRVKVF